MLRTMSTSANLTVKKKKELRKILPKSLREICADRLRTMPTRSVHVQLTSDEQVSVLKSDGTPTEVNSTVLDENEERFNQKIPSTLKASLPSNNKPQQTVGDGIKIKNTLQHETLNQELSEKKKHREYPFNPQVRYSTIKRKKVWQVGETCSRLLSVSPNQVVDETADEQSINLASNTSGVLSRECLYLPSSCSSQYLTTEKSSTLSSNVNVLFASTTTMPCSSLSQECLPESEESVSNREQGVLQDRLPTPSEICQENGSTSIASNSEPCVRSSFALLQTPQLSPSQLVIYTDHQTTCELGPDVNGTPVSDEKNKTKVIEPKKGLLLPAQTFSVSPSDISCSTWPVTSEANKTKVITKINKSLSVPSFPVTLSVSEPLDGDGSFRITSNEEHKKCEKLLYCTETVLSDCEIPKEDNSVNVSKCTNAVEDDSIDINLLLQKKQEKNATFVNIRTKDELYQNKRNDINKRILKTSSCCEIQEIVSELIENICDKMSVKNTTLSSNTELEKGYERKDIFREVQETVSELIEKVCDKMSVKNTTLSSNIELEKGYERKEIFREVQRTVSELVENICDKMSVKNTTLSSNIELEKGYERKDIFCEVQETVSELIEKVCDELSEKNKALNINTELEKRCDVNKEIVHISEQCTRFLCLLLERVKTSSEDHHLENICKKSSENISDNKKKRSSKVFFSDKKQEVVKNETTSKEEPNKCQIDSPIFFKYQKNDEVSELVESLPEATPKLLINQGIDSADKQGHKRLSKRVEKFCDLKSNAIGKQKPNNSPEVGMSMNPNYTPNNHPENQKYTNVSQADTSININNRETNSSSYDCVGDGDLEYFCVDNKKIRLLKTYVPLKRLDIFTKADYDEAFRNGGVDAKTTDAIRTNFHLGETDKTICMKSATKKILKENGSEEEYCNKTMSIVYTCTLCPVRKCRQKSIVRHLRYDHGCKGYYKCGYCKYLSSKLNKLKQHVKRDHRGKMMKLSLMYKPETVSLEEKKKVLDDELKTEESFFSATANTNKEYIRSVEKEGEGTSKMKTDSKEKSLIKESKQFNVFVTENSNIVCNKSKKETRRCSLKGKLNIKNEDSQTSVCIVNKQRNASSVIGLKKSDESELSFGSNELIKNKQILFSKIKRNDQKVSKNKLSCPFCEYSIGDRYSLRLHIFREIKYRRLACSICNEQRYDLKEIKAHFKKFHRDQKLSFCQRYDPDTENCIEAFLRNKKNDTVVCQKLPATRNQTLKPQKTRYKYECVICGIKQRDTIDLQRHLYHHKKYQPFKCCHCGKTYISSCSVKNHLQKYHPGLRPDFKIIRIKKIEEWVNKIVSSQQSSKYIESEHEEKHPESGHLFCCWKDCNFVTTDKSKLKYHFMMHFCKRHFSCPYCQVACDTEAGVKSHCDIEHADEKLSSSAKSREPVNLNKKKEKLNLKED
ncbi:uncharacterized protein LOC106463755 [Limulus polyphemus]|uniref:Uncharacterized protein LOC106463755 n=1 Tax=Limulus polyphemus TaxID=6850 RepID=A0ABM1STT7_LIMPO|nr:uncharacterized protein LOC106463755 [Limulus polyphemus]XP_013779271.2 uncharacterized protein LOC106463755 [Limulus polyphemus]XP_013779272.2 uncharacterized protein LOC106463755 [Limulus polyphemus]XP_013779273.2 uncharacterized protein LOC106463755 [Limulus polyphemus]XP_022247042.1 uncharacterized protein LOC106463755 [Limulus polyphemus]XP_022247043.1 uncharacterized protein LOC106463755 [Limulus polyphemus]